MPTHREKLLKTEYELARIFNAQAMRAWTLSADIPLIEETATLSLKDIPTVSYSNASHFINCQIIDAGRANSASRISFFEDPYHRVADFGGKLFFSLAQNGCVIPSNPGSKIIPIVSDLVFFVYFYLLKKSKGEKIYQLFEYDVPIPHVGYTEKLHLIKFPEHQTDEILNDLGMLGALPNRDWQLKYFQGRVDNLVGMRDFFLNTLRRRVKKSDFDAPNISLGRAFADEKATLLHLLESKNRLYSSELAHEQRLFYNKLLIKLVKPFNFNEGNYDEKCKIQASLSLQRMQRLISNSDDISYSSFLRTIETCIDEISILLTLEKKASSVLDVVRSAKEFITDTVGIPPQAVTFRSSAMQGLWTCFEMYLSPLVRQGQSISFFIPHTIYYEIVNVFQKIFDFPGAVHEHFISAKTDIASFKDLPYHSKVIYDLYLTNFESNVKMAGNQNEFIDINAFVSNQFHLRRETQSDKPLVVIIDNTMSDYDEVYLPFLLMEFAEEIHTGKLCVLVCHSGNKYFHLGTDKALAALMYGYYNPEYFPFVEGYFRGLDENKLGDLDYRSPTILLTEMFMKQAKEEILSYGPLIRQRTMHVFRQIPEILLRPSGYFNIVSPISNATYEALPSSCTSLRNSSGFVFIKSNSNAFYPGDIHEKIYINFQELLVKAGIRCRDGFGLSQTTHALIRVPKYPDAIRISIGTESLDAITTMIGILCDYLVKINTLMEKYRIPSQGGNELLLNVKNPRMISLVQAVKDIYQETLEQLTMVLEDTEEHTPILDSMPDFNI